MKTNDEMHSYSANILRGELVSLRRLREEDLERLEAWWNDPEWMMFQAGTIAPAPSTPTIEMFRTWSSNKDASGYGFSIQDNTSENLVGHVTLWGIDPVVRSATLGIMIGSEHVGRGFGADAVKVIMRFVFEELGLNKMELTVWEYNLRGIRTYEKTGFRIEGRRRAATFHAGRYWNQLQMGILASEYFAAK